MSSSAARPSSTMIHAKALQAKELAQKKKELARRKDIEAKKKAEALKKKRAEERQQANMPPPANSKYVRKKSEFMSKTRFRNTLPEPVLEPVHLKYPFNMSRYVAYQTTSLEKNYKFELQTETNMGIPINLIDAKQYEVASNVHVDDMAPEDMVIADIDDVLAEHDKNMVAKRERPNVAWLRKTEYMGNDLWDSVYKKTKSTEMYPDQTIQNKLRTMEDNPLEMTVERQVELIEDTFNFVNAGEFVHPSKRGLKAVDSRPLLPDTEHWPTSYLQVIFEAPPFPDPPKDGKEDVFDREGAVARPILRAFKVPSGPQNQEEDYLAFLMPKKRRTVPEGEEEDEANKDPSAVEYAWLRDYRFRMATEQMNQAEAQHFALEFGKDSVKYNVISKRVGVSKKRARVEERGDDGQISTRYSRPAYITRTTREHDPEELVMRHERAAMLTSAPLHAEAAGDDAEAAAEETPAAPEADE